MPDSSPPRRTPWAPIAERLTLGIGRLLGPIMGRPSDAQLGRMARKHRPAPPIRIPSAADLGVVDHLAEGRAALAAGALAEALHHFSSLTRSHPTHPWAWHGRGDALQALDDPTGALDAYTRAAELQPDEALHHGGRCNALEQLGRTEQARAAWDRATELPADIHWMRPQGPP